VSDTPTHGPPGLAEAATLMADIIGRVDAFCSALRADGVHVGVNGHCPTCRAPWPCPKVEPSASPEQLEEFVGHHLAHHFGPTGGCYCTCPQCVGPWVNDRRMCTCAGCSHDCAALGRLEK